MSPLYPLLILIISSSIIGCQEAEFLPPSALDETTSSLDTGNTGLTKAECLENRISNGHFEDTDTRVGTRNRRQLSLLVSGRNWDHYLSIPSWSATNNHVVEVQANTSARAYDGDHFVEIDSQSEVQTEFLSCGGQHTLQFAYLPRNKNGSANTVEVYVNGQLAKLVGGNTSSSSWTLETVSLSLSSGTHTLSFSAHSNSGGSTVGALIDSITLIKQ